MENPELCAALREFARNRDARTEQELAHQLRRAVFLVPVLAGDERTAPRAEPARPELEARSTLELIPCADASGNPHVPLFTDGAAIRSWTDKPLATLALPAADAWNLVLAQESYAGAVVNPGSGEHTLPLPRPTIAFLRGDAELEGADDVEDAIDALAQDPSEPNRVELYVALQKAMLYLVAVGLPAGKPIDESTPIQMLASTARDGSTQLVAFSCVEEVQKSAPGAQVFAMRGVEILRIVSTGPYSGLIVNPGSTWAMIPKLDAEVVVSDAASREQA